MQYHLTDEQAQIRDVVGAFLADHYDHDARMGIVASPERWSPEIWRAFAEDLGILGLALPEASGGLGGGAVDHLLIMDAFGAALVVEPYLETCVMAANVLAQSTSPIAGPLLEGIVNGQVRFAFAAQEPQARFGPMNVTTRARRSENGWTLSGSKTVVVGLAGASHLFISARVSGEQTDHSGLALFVAPADHSALVLKPGITIDGRTAADVTFGDLQIPADACVIGESDGAAVLMATIDRATAAICAEAVGIMRRLIADTVAYLEQRKQFGVHLADFQVLQHRLADMQVELEHAQAMAFFAAGMLDAPVARRSVAISAAKAQVSRALRHVAQEAVQMHGAMGMTDELPIGHLFKRATSLESQFGSPDYHIARVVASGADLSGFAAA